MSEPEKANIPVHNIGEPLDSYLSNIKILLSLLKAIDFADLKKGKQNEEPIKKIEAVRIALSTAAIGIGITGFSLTILGTGGAAAIPQLLGGIAVMTAKNLGTTMADGLTTGAESQASGMADTAIANTAGFGIAELGKTAPQVATGLTGFVAGVGVPLDAKDIYDSGQRIAEISKEQNQTKGKFATFLENLSSIEHQVKNLKGLDPKHVFKIGEILQIITHIRTAIDSVESGAVAGYVKLTENKAV